MKILSGEELTVEEILARVPAPESDAVFSLAKVEALCMPHPYCITPKHLEYNDGMYLTRESMAKAELKGAVCDICKKAVRAGRQPFILKIDAHTESRTLFIEVPDNKDLNAVTGLVTYLNRVKHECELLGIDGFAFPVKEATSEVQAVS